MRLHARQPAPSFTVKDIFDNSIALSDFAGQKLMLSFYRFASCPFCNLRVQQLMHHYPVLQKRGLHILAFWQSPKESMLKRVGQQNPPFPFISDPTKAVYKLYGVEQSWKAAIKLLLHPSLLYKAVKLGFHSDTLEGEKDLVPADFLIGPDLTIHRAYYGSHIGDHVPIPEIEHFLTQTCMSSSQMNILGDVV